MAVVRVYPTIHNKFMLLSFEHRRRRRRRRLQMLSDSVNYREKRLYIDRSLPPLSLTHSAHHLKHPVSMTFAQRNASDE